VLLGIGADSTTVTLLPIYNWKESMRAAMAKIELWRGNNLIFTDYLGLYKFREGWRIVNKIYHRH